MPKRKNTYVQWRLSELAIASLLVLLHTPAFAQKPVYRCETRGQVSYAHQPCVGAKEIDSTPTQGMDKMTGQSRKGSAVQRHEHQTIMAEALRPLTGMTPDQYRVHQRRFNLTPQDQRECRELDAALPELNQRAQKAASATSAAADVALFRARSRFHALNC